MYYRFEDWSIGSLSAFRFNTPIGKAQNHQKLGRATMWVSHTQETRDCHQEQLNRYRFRHRPLEYLASLEKRWEQATCTEVLLP